MLTDRLFSETCLILSLGVLPEIPGAEETRHEIPAGRQGGIPAAFHNGLFSLKDAKLPIRGLKSLRKFVGRDITPPVADTGCKMKSSMKERGIPLDSVLANILNGLSWGMLVFLISTGLTIVFGVMLILDDGVRLIWGSAYHVVNPPAPWSAIRSCFCLTNRVKGWRRSSLRNSVG
jgi:hypothetical protein